MKSLENIKNIIINNKKFFEEKYYIKEIGIFGSYIKGNQQDESDLDILVDFNKPIGLLKFVSLKNFLSELTNTKVDLVMKSSLKPRIGKSILKDVVYL